MTQRWHIEIPGEPKGRQETQAIGFIGAGGVARARNVKQKQTRSYEAWVAAFVGNALVGVPRIDQPVRLDLLAVFPRPKRLDADYQPDGLVFFASKPDRDNIEKAVQDGMRAVWRDDALVVVGTTAKAYAERSGSPRVEVWLSLLTGPFEFPSGQVVFPEGQNPRARGPRPKVSP